MENEEMNTTNQDNISKMRGKDTINNASSGLARKYNGELFEYLMAILLLLLLFFVIIIIIILSIQLTCIVLFNFFFIL